MLMLPEVTEAVAVFEQLNCNPQAVLLLVWLAEVISLKGSGVPTTVQVLSVPVPVPPGQLAPVAVGVVPKLSLNGVVVAPVPLPVV
jgi:hypothetical protein